MVTKGLFSNSLNFPGESSSSSSATANGGFVLPEYGFPQEIQFGVNGGGFSSPGHRPYYTQMETPAAAAESSTSVNGYLYPQNYQPQPPLMQATESSVPLPVNNSNRNLAAAEFYENLGANSRSEINLHRPNNNLDFHQYYFSGSGNNPSSSSYSLCANPDRHHFYGGRNFSSSRSTFDPRFSASPSCFQQHSSPLYDHNNNLDFDFARLSLSSNLPATFPAVSNSNPRNNSSFSSQPNNNRNLNLSIHDLNLQLNRLSRNNRAAAAALDGYNRLENSPQAQSRQRADDRLFNSLQAVQGMISYVAKDQDGCRFLQKLCEEGKPEDVELIFSEIKDHMCDLMTVDSFVNHLSQHFFEACNERQLDEILYSVIVDDGKLMSVCVDNRGTRCVQKLIEHLTTQHQRTSLVSVLRRITIPLIKNVNGHRVIEHCLKTLSVDVMQPILVVVADNCLDIAKDKSGCCVMQPCVLYANGRPKERLLTEIIANAKDLAEHQYGNYVVQYVLGMKIPEVTTNILKQLSGNYVTLSQNKYSSNVVEKCLKDSEESQSSEIIKEILKSESQFVHFLTHQYSNYVAQTALQVAKGPVRDLLRNKIQQQCKELQTHPFGKKVLALAKNMKDKHHLRV